jgi:hypothetical protein
VIRVLFVVLVLLPTLAAAQTLSVTVVGQPVVEFSHARDACDPLDYPDAPARAVRLATGEVLLFAPHFRNRVLRGPTLLAARPDCRIVFAGDERDDPAAFDDRAWLVAPYTLDGAHIVSLVHNEFHGHRRPWLCPSGRYMDCWYNAITLAVSDDGGRHFIRPPHALIAALPYRYDQATGAHRGYFNPTNILHRDGFFYAMAFATEAFAQKPGNCLLRTDSLANPASWRAWDGHGFGASFVDPYTSHDDPAAHVCAPVGAGKLRWPVTSLVRHAPSGLFVATMMNAAPARKAEGGGVFVATSPDLLVWSEPALLWPIPGSGGWTCGEAAPVAYPSLLDPASPSRDFETVGATAMLFLTRWNPAGCKLGADRDLIRLPVSLTRLHSPGTQ